MKQLDEDFLVQKKINKKVYGELEFVKNKFSKQSEANR